MTLQHCKLAVLMLRFSNSISKGADLSSNVADYSILLLAAGRLTMLPQLESLRKKHDSELRDHSNQKLREETRKRMLREDALNKIFLEVEREREESLMAAFSHYDELTDEEKSRILQENDMEDELGSYYPEDQIDYDTFCSMMRRKGDTRSDPDDEMHKASSAPINFKGKCKMDCE